MSKVFVEHKEFSFVGQIVKYDGFWDLLLAICQAWYPLFCLLRLQTLVLGAWIRLSIMSAKSIDYWIMDCKMLLKSGLAQAAPLRTPQCIH